VLQLHHHQGAQIFKLFLRQFTCASVGELKKNFDNIKMHHVHAKITNKTIQQIKTNTVKQENNGRANKIISTR